MKSLLATLTGEIIETNSGWAVRIHVKWGSYREDDEYINDGFLDKADAEFYLNQALPNIAKMIEKDCNKSPFEDT